MYDIVYIVYCIIYINIVYSIYTSTSPARSQARKVDDTDLGEEALQRAARIEYAIKVGNRRKPKEKFERTEFSNCKI